MKRTSLLLVAFAFTVGASACSSDSQGKLIPGPAGPDGPAGPMGPAGPAGAKGDPGPAGPKGDPGAAGTKGDPGAAGTKGDPGVAGPAGASGSPGAAGAKGDPGATGAKGDPGPGSVAFYMEQTAPATASGQLNWVDVVTARTFHTDGSATLDLMANGAVTAASGSGYARCLTRFVVDGTPTGDATLGDMIASVPAGFSGSGGAGSEFASLTLVRRAMVSTGDHVVKVQLARAPQSNSDCIISATANTGLRLSINVR